MAITTSLRRLSPRLTHTHIHGLYGSTDVVIHSSAAEKGIAVERDKDGVKLHGFTINGGNTNLSLFGILYYQNDDGYMSSIRIEDLQGIGLGLNDADDFTASYLVVTNNGRKPGGQQAVWYSLSDNVDLLNVTVYGNDTTYGADGSINCFNGNNIRVLDANSVHSGSAGIGSLGCTNMEIGDSTVAYSSEFGIDIADGSSGLDIHDNTIHHSQHTAIVLTDHDWGACGYCGTPPDDVEFTNNDMDYNNLNNYWNNACDNGDDIFAISLINDPTNVTIGTGNTTDEGDVSCDVTK